MRAKNGSGYITPHGYRVYHKSRDRTVFEHVIVAEKALGHALPDGAVIHHVNENKADNRPENLVICPDENYHRLLHRRMRALNACGHADWRPCQICGNYDDPKNMYMRPCGVKGYHRACAAAKELERYHAKKELK